MMKDFIDKNIKVVFMPYKITMWDSLESIYETATKDEECDVKVVPIPYYEKDKNNNFIYEGEKFKNKGINIVNYEQFCLEHEKPDIIFIHNVYDDNNTITEVDSRFFTKELKKCTDMLVYVPYYIPSPGIGNNEMYVLPGLDNVDKIILAGDFAEKTAVIKGVSQEKILNLGSPKFDYIKNKLNKCNIPKEWKEKITNKKVMLLNTGCLFFNDHLTAYTELQRIFEASRYLEDLVIIWRPHPLTEASIKKYNPEFLNVYLKILKYITQGNVYYTNILLDKTDNYLKSLSVADILISPTSSILNSFLLTNKPIIRLDVWDYELSITKNYYYHYYNQEEPINVFIKEFVNKGYDPLEECRKGVVEQIYKNLDNNCGKEIFINIKKLIDKAI